MEEGLGEKKRGNETETKMQLGGAPLAKRRGLPWNRAEGTKSITVQRGRERAVSGAKGVRIKKG